MITYALQSPPAHQGTDVRSKRSPCLEALTCCPPWRHLHHLERSILRCPHPQTLLAPAHAPWMLSLLRLNQDRKKRNHHQRQRKRRQSPYHDGRIIRWIDAVGALVFSEVDRPPACAQDMSVGERKSAGRGGAERGWAKAGRGGAGRGGRQDITLKYSRRKHGQGKSLIKLGIKIRWNPDRV